MPTLSICGFRLSRFAFKQITLLSKIKWLLKSEVSTNCPQRITALRSKGICKNSASLNSCCRLKINCSAHIRQPLFFKADVVGSAALSRYLLSKKDLTALKKSPLVVATYTVSFNISSPLIVAPSNPSFFNTL